MVGCFSACIRPKADFFDTTPLLCSTVACLSYCKTDPQCQAGRCGPEYPTGTCTCIRAVSACMYVHMCVHVWVCVCVRWHNCVYNCKFYLYTAYICLPLYTWYIPLHVHAPLHLIYTTLCTCSFTLDIYHFMYKLLYT